MNLPLVPGFDLLRQLGPTTWEAVETSLDRRVALRTITSQFDATQWPERPGVAALFAVVDGTAHRFAVSQIPPNSRTFTALVAGGARPRDQRRWLDQVNRILIGTEHGTITGDDILIGTDGQVLLLGFGESQASNRLDDHAAVDALRPPARSRRRSSLALCVFAAVCAGTVLLLGREPAPVPPELGSATPYGSRLAADPGRATDCLGKPASGNSPRCTLMQMRLPGRNLVTDRGVVRQWVVRGVSGRVRLQVIVPKDGGWQRIADSPHVIISDPDEWTAFRTRLPVPSGARFGLELSPGTSVELAHGVTGARLARFLGPPSFMEPSIPSPEVSVEELLIRVDVVPESR
jgi:hypothetical protein